MIVAAVRATVRGTVGLVTSAGRLIKLNVLELPAMPPERSLPSPGRGHAGDRVRVLRPGETVVGLAATDSWRAPGLALGTAEGVVKRVLPDYPQNRDEFELITLKAGDRVVGAVQLSGESDELVFITPDAQLLRFARLLGPAAGPGGRRAWLASGCRLARRWCGSARRTLAAASGTPSGPPGSYPRRGGHRGGQRGRPAGHRGRHA